MLRAMHRILFATLASLFVVPALAAADPKAPAPAARMADPYWTLLQAKDRTEEDRKDDASRKPLEVLRFIGVQKGWKVADLGAGGGYLTELLARAVGPTGKVYAQNSKVVIEKFVAKEWPARLARPINKDVVRVDRESDDPLPPEAKDLDLVTMGFTYHDLVWLGVNRDQVNKKVFEALKPGGLYVIMDHSAKEGTGTAETKTLHRIEEKALVDEVKKAGFELQKSGDFLRNKDDPRTESVFGPLRGKTDRFVLAFVKPKQ
jgi:predicted methyltransferase